MNKRTREPLFHITKRAALPWWAVWAIRGGALLAALIVCGVITSLVTGENPFQVYAAIYKGSFGTARKLWVLLAVTGILLVGLRSDVAVITGQLCYALVQTVACLLGAAVVVFLYTRLGPERRVFGGAVAVMLYLLAPGLLAIVGIADQFLHFRTTQARKPDRT